MSTSTTSAGAFVSAPSRDGARRRAPRRRFVRFLRWVFLVVGIGAAASSLAATHQADIGGKGLIDALHPLYFAGVALITVGFYVGLEDRRRPSVASLACVASLITLLHGLPGIVEANPRFPVAWLHVGFIDHIAERGSLLLQLDARFSWAGFFAGGAFVERATGTDNLLWLVRYAPVAINAFACWGIYLLGRPLGLSVRQRLAALPIFVIANWAGQDYFAPQATAFCLYLVFVVVVITFFSDQQRSPTTRIARWLRPQPMTAAMVSSRTRFGVYAGCLLGIAAIVMSHQLTPPFLAAVLLLLALTGTLRIRALAFIAGFAALAWLSFAGEAYWAGHLTRLTGSVGKVGNLAAENLGNRAEGAGSARRLVLGARIGTAAACWLGAVTVLWACRRRRRTPVALACLLVAPFPMILVQPYGGEMIIRIFFFTLPPVALLLAMMVVPAHKASSIGRRVVAGILCAAMLPAFVLARYGNERYEQVTDDDVTVLDAMYDTIPANSVVFVVNRFTILYADRVEEVRFRELQAREPSEMLKEVLTESKAEHRFVLLTKSQEAYGEQVGGRPKGWLTGLTSDLANTGRFETVTRAGRSVLLELVSP